MFKFKSSVASPFKVITFLLCFGITPLLTFADDVSSESTQVENTTSFESIKKNIRIRTFSEYMTPSITGGTGSIPWEDGKALLPTNLLNIVWADYEIAKDIRVGYWQRMNVNLISSPRGNGVHTVMRNPRFAIRKLNVYNVVGLNTIYDFYVQPGFAPESRPDAMGRSLEFGFRTSHAYPIPASRFNVGLVTEVTKAFSFNGDPVANVYGWAMPWTSYDLSKTFSTQHIMSVSFQQLSKDPWYRVVHDYPMPLAIQNGIGINLSENISTSLLVNNYLNTAPTLKNTWASLWLMMTIL